jgi:hypothetical protein
MKKVYAEVNFGRWIVRCPVTPYEHATDVDPSKDKLYVCGACFPDADGSFKTHPDAPAFLRANKAKKVYTIVYPPNVSEIMNALRYRPTANMNWLPGESIGYLEADNAAHKVGADMPIVTEIRGANGTDL